MFRRPQSAQLFRSLEARGALRISSFSAGDELLAVHFGGVAEGRFYSWIAAYDPAHGRYSPGRLLLEELLRERLCCRDREFDFGIGDSSYKWHYATHNRTVGPLGRPPVALRLQRTALKSARRVLTGWPGLLARARRLRLRMQERGVRL
jgi:CelD/BcsL family acetyltransferase involved in cellulose biosynthesis